MQHKPLPVYEKKQLLGRKLLYGKYVETDEWIEHKKKVHRDYKRDYNYWRNRLKREKELKNAEKTDTSVNP